MRSTLKKLLAVVMAAVMIVLLVPVTPAGRAAATAYAADLADGTYSISGEGYSTGMIAPDETDFPSIVVVKNGIAVLVTRSYAPNKYDAAWKGKRSEAPSDPSTASVVYSRFIEDDNGYKSNGSYGSNAYEVDGVLCKAVEFEIPLSSSEIEAGLVYFVLRRSSWSTSNAGQWMGSNDQFFSFGTLTKLNDSTVMPSGREPGASPDDPEPAETFGFTLQVGQYKEGEDFHTASFEGVVYALKDADGVEYQPSSVTSGMLTYSKLDASKTYVFTATKDGWTVVTQGEWNVDAHAYDYEYTGNDEISITITKADDGKNISEYTNKGMVFRVKPREANVVDLALEEVPSDLSIFTSETAAAVKAAVDAADPEETDESKLQEMADAINSAIANLVPLDGVYTAAFEHTGNGMFKIIDVISLDVKNGQMTLNFVNGSQTYIKLYLGTTEEANAANESAYILPGEAAKASNGKDGYNWTVPVAKLNTEVALAAYSKSKNTFNSTGNFLVKANSLKRIISEYPINLSIYDEELMFKIVNAYLDKEDNQIVLKFALSAKGYESIFAGTYDEAIANGRNKDNWINYQTATVECVYETASGIQNDGTAEKYQFTVPVSLNESGETRIPIVAISKSRMTAAEKANPDNPDYSSAFTARQAIINIDEKTILTGNYKDTIGVTVTSELNSFSVNSSGTLYTVGTPTANEYTCQPTITMQDETYDKVFVGSAADAGKEGAKTIAIGDDGSFEIPFVNSLGKTPQISKGVAVAAFHVAANANYEEADTWVERTFTIDDSAKTVTVSGNELTAAALELTINNKFKMFTVEKAFLVPDGDSENLVIVIGSISYDQLYVGNGADNPTSAIEGIVEGGKTTFTVPVSKFDEDILISVRSSSKKTWNNRTINVSKTAATLVTDTVNADTKKISDAIAEAGKTDRIRYTEESLAALDKAVAAGQTELDKKTKTNSVDQAKVDKIADDITAAIAALEKKSGIIDLYPTNEELMFKVVNAYLDIVDGEYTLVFALNATGYEDMMQSRLDDALAKGGDKTDWVHYSKATVDAKYDDTKGAHDDGMVEKYQFRMPVAITEKGITTIPVISISNSKASEAEAKAGTGTPDYSAAFIARRFDIDIDNKTILTGNYKETVDITVTSKIDTFKVDSKGTMYMLGAASSNEYKLEPTITMLDDTYDMVFVGNAVDATDAAAEKITAEKTFTLKFFNSHDTDTTMINGSDPITAAFHVTSTGEWVERQFVIDVKAMTVTISGDEIKTEDEMKDTPANYKQVEDAKAALPADLSIFTDDSAKAVTDAVAAVKEGLTADKQAEVDKMASAIANAAAGLTLKDGVYTLPANSLKTDIVDMIIEVENGKMNAYLIMSGRAQDKIFDGTAAEAETASGSSDRLGLVKNSTGAAKASLFRIPLEGLDELKLAVHTAGGWSDRNAYIDIKAIKKCSYTIKEADETIVPGKAFLIVSDADFSKLAGVLVDGKLIDAENYTAVSGSTKVTINGDYTATLAEGSHEVTILSVDGLAKGTYNTAKETEETPAEEPTDQPSDPTPQPEPAPQTGDESNAVMYAVVFIVSLLAAAFVLLRKRIMK